MTKPAITNLFFLFVAFIGCDGCSSQAVGSGTTASRTNTTSAPVTVGALGIHVQDIPDDPKSYTNALSSAVSQAIAGQASSGSFETPGKQIDVGDNSLGVSAVLALQWDRNGHQDANLVGPFQRSVDWFLANRVVRTDNPGYAQWQRIKNSGEPYARFDPYTTSTGAAGDWPTTAWALLHVGNVLAHGDGLLTDAQRSALTSLGQGYWRWLTKVSQFNIQDADNQAIASVAGALGLGNELARQGQMQAASALRQDALNTYTTLIRPLRQQDRGFTFYPEHSQGYDQNYGTIALSFLYRAWILSSEQMFYDDGLAMAQYIDMRLGARGFDYGGPRHMEDHTTLIYGLRAYSSAVKDDLGRFLGPNQYYYHGWPKAPDGHFTFMWIWEIGDGSIWYRQGMDATTANKIRIGRTSVVLREDLSPYLVSAADTDVIEAVANKQHGFGLYFEDAAGVHLFGNHAGAQVSDEMIAGTRVKIVDGQQDGPNGVVHTRIGYILDGCAVRMVAAFDTTATGNASIGYLAGLPYITATHTSTPPADQQEKILQIAGRSGGSLSFGTDGGTLRDAAGINAGAMAILGSGGVLVTNPPAASDHAFSSSATLNLSLENYTRAIDNGNPAKAWAETDQTNLLRIPAETGTQGVWRIAQITYAPASETGDSPAMAQATTAVRAQITQ